MERMERKKIHRKRSKERKLLNVLLLAGLLAGCGSAKEEEQDRHMEIGVSIYSQYDTFISEMMSEVERYVQEMEEKYEITITLDVQNAGGNQSIQNDQMEYFMEQGCDLVLINIVDRTDASTIIERGKNADTPIIFFNRELVEEDLERWDRLYYVGADAFESGIIQGEILVERLEQDFASVDKNGDGVLQYVMLEGEAGHQDAIVRSMYAINTVTEAGFQVEKLADEIANWNRDQGKTKMVQWLEEFEDSIEVVFANNDDMALGARDALRDAGYYENGGKRPPVILGIDGIKEAAEAVERGEFLGTVLNDSKGQAQAMLELAYSLHFGEPLDEAFTLVDEKYIRQPYRKFQGELEENIPAS